MWHTRNLTKTRPVGRRVRTNVFQKPSTSKKQAKEGEKQNEKRPFYIAKNGQKNWVGACDWNRPTGRWDRPFRKKKSATVKAAKSKRWVCQSLTKENGDGRPFSQQTSQRRRASQVTEQKQNKPKKKGGGGKKGGGKKRRIRRILAVGGVKKQREIRM